MNAEERQEIIEIVGMVDRCINQLWGDATPWERLADRASDEISEQLQAVRHRLKELTVSS